MIILKIYLKSLGVTSIGVLSLTLILTILHYFNLIGDKSIEIIKLVIAIIAVASGSFIIGRRSLKNGWLEGLKYGGIIIVLIALSTLIFKLGFSYGTLIYYLIILVSAVIGSMIGISVNERKKTK